MGRGDQHPRLGVVILWSLPMQFSQQKLFIYGDTGWSFPKAGVLVLLFSSYSNSTSLYYLTTTSPPSHISFPLPPDLLCIPSSSPPPPPNNSWFMTHSLAFYRPLAWFRSDVDLSTCYWITWLAAIISEVQSKYTFGAGAYIIKKGNFWSINSSIVELSKSAWIKWLAAIVTEINAKY